MATSEASPPAPLLAPPLAPFVTPFLAIIPARRAALRLPDKPLLDLSGKPMVVRVAERASLSHAARVVVATDDADILAACRMHGVEAMLTASHHASGTERLAEVATRLQLQDEAIVVNVQGDEPLIPPALIDRCAAELASAPDCAMATACAAIVDARELHNPNVVKVVLDRASRALYFSRAAIPWPRDALAGDVSPGSSLGYRHIGLYAYRADFLMTYPTLAAAPLENIEKLEQLRTLWHGYRIAVFETGESLEAGVDTPADLERVRAVFAAQKGPAAEPGQTL